MARPQSSSKGASKQWVYKTLFDIDINDIDYTVNTYAELPSTPTGTGLILAKVETATGLLWSKKKAGIYEYLVDTWHYRGSGYNISMATDAELLAGTSNNEARRFSVDNMTILPIGFTYTQYPTKKTPEELGYIGTWENISSQFAGDFFRAEGGNAANFESGEQLDKVKLHEHKAVLVANNTVITGNGGGEFPVLFGDNNDVDNFYSSSAIREPRNGSEAFTQVDGGDIETRSINHTIRIWERVA